MVMEVAGISEFFLFFFSAQWMFLHHSVFEGQSLFIEI